MQEDEVLQSLKTGKYSSDRTCWDTNRRFLLRATLHLSIGFLVLLILLQIILFSVYFHKLDDVLPVSITPYASIAPENSTIVPCVFPRNTDPLPGDTHCETDGYCPNGWNCSIVADEESQVNTFMCLNEKFSCGDLHYCAPYINGLTSTNDTTIPAKISDLAVSRSLYLLASIPMYFSVLLLAFMWVVFTFWSAVIGDPFNPNLVEDSTGVARSFYEKYRKIVAPDRNSSSQCRINFFIMFPLTIILFLSGVSFLASTSPTLNELTETAVADCFVDPWLYLFSSSMLGWITGFFVSEMVLVFTVFFFFSLYTVKPLFYGIWDARVFLTIFVLIFIIVVIGVTIELTSVILMAV